MHLNLVYRFPRPPGLIPFFNFIARFVHIHFYAIINWACLMTQAWIRGIWQSCLNWARERSSLCSNWIRGLSVWMEGNCREWLPRLNNHIFSSHISTSRDSLPEVQSWPRPSSPNGRSLPSHWNILDRFFHTKLPSNSGQFHQSSREGLNFSLPFFLTIIFFIPSPPFALSSSFLALIIPHLVVSASFFLQGGSEWTLRRQQNR